MPNIKNWWKLPSELSASQNNIGSSAPRPPIEPLPEDFELTEAQVEQYQKLLEVRDWTIKRELPKRFILSVILISYFFLGLPWAITSLSGKEGEATPVINILGTFLAPLALCIIFGFIIACILLGIMDSISASSWFINMRMNRMVSTASKSQRGDINEYVIALKEYKEDLEIYNAAQQARFKMLERQRLNYWQGLRGVALEQSFAELSRNLGYEVSTTPTTGDGGIDLILRQSSQKIIVQCKGQAGHVGVGIARELFGVLMDSDADRAVLVAPNGWTQGVEDFCAGKNIRLYSAKELAEQSGKLS